MENRHEEGDNLMVMRDELGGNRIVGTHCGGVNSGEKTLRDVPHPAGLEKMEENERNKKKYLERHE